MRRGGEEGYYKLISQVIGVGTMATKFVRSVYYMYLWRH